MMCRRKTGRMAGIFTLIVLTGVLMCSCGKANTEEKKEEGINETELILPDEKETGSDMDTDTETDRETEPVTGAAGNTSSGQTGQSEYVETDQTTENSTENRTEGNIESDTADISQEDNGEITLPYVPFS